MKDHKKERERVVSVDFGNINATGIVVGLVDRCKLQLTVEQMFVLANLPYGSFGGFEKEVYAAFDAAGFRAFVPIDNIRKAGL